jgi:hypothetical protein
MAKNDHLKLQIDASSEAGKEAVEDGNDDLAHDLDATGHGPDLRGFLCRMGFIEGIGTGAITATPGARFKALPNCSDSIVAPKAYVIAQTYQNAFCGTNKVFPYISTLQVICFYQRIVIQTINLTLFKEKDS